VAGRPFDAASYGTQGDVTRASAEVAESCRARGSYSQPSKQQRRSPQNRASSNQLRGKAAAVQRAANLGRRKPAAGQPAGAHTHAAGAKPTTFAACEWCNSCTSNTLGSTSPVCVGQQQGWVCHRHCALTNAWRCASEPDIRTPCWGEHTNSVPIAEFFWSADSGLPHFLAGAVPVLAQR